MEQARGRTVAVVAASDLKRAYIGVDQLAVICLAAVGDSTGRRQYTSRAGGGRGR